MKKFVMLAASLMALAAAAPSQAAVTINFDNGTNGVSVGATYAALGVTFTNTQFASNFSLSGSSSPLGIRAPGTYNFGPTNAMIGTFTTGASSVSIRGVDVGGAGILLRAYNSLGTLVGTSSFVGTGLGVGTFQDLTVNAVGIKSFRISQVTTCCGDGVVFDNLAFAPVPEPATWAMMLVGFGVVGGAMRRRQKVSVSFA